MAYGYGYGYSGVLSPEQISPFAAFVTGLGSGAEKMIDIAKKAQETRKAAAEMEAAAAIVKARRDAGQTGQAGEPTTQPAGVNIPPPASTGGGAGGAGGTGGDGGGGTPSQTAAQNAQEVAKVWKDEFGWSDAAIAGAVANGFTESGMGENTKPGAAGELGAWQFNPKGELPNYQKAYPNDMSLVSQARYIGNWMLKNMPGYKDISDPQIATDQFMHGFERPANAVTGSRYGDLNKANIALGYTHTPEQQRAFAGAVPQVPSYGGGLTAGAGGALPAIPTAAALPMPTIGGGTGGTTTTAGGAGQQAALIPPQGFGASPLQYASLMARPQLPPPPSAMQMAAQQGGPLSDYITMAQLSNPNQMALMPAGNLVT